MNIIDALITLLTSANPFQEKTMYIYKDDPNVYNQPKQGQTISQPTPQPTVQQNVQQPIQQILQPTQMPVQQDVNTDEIQRQLTQGFIKLYGKNTPALRYVPQIIDYIKTNQFHRNNPYLAASQLIAESSGGGNITRPNNPTNWGINYPGNNEVFATMSPNDIFDRYLTGIAGRDSNYKEFNTGKPLTDDEFSRLSRKYVGPDDTTYGQRLKEHIKYFQEQ